MEMNIYYVGLNTMYHNFYKVSTIQECYEYLKNKKVLAIDIETTQKFKGIYEKEGLDPYVSKIVMFQIGDEHRQYVIDYREIDISILLPILSSKAIIKVGHNIKFEYLHILHNNRIKLNNVYDTMIVEQISFNGYKQKNGLADLNRRYLSIEVDKSTRNEFATIGDKPFSLKQINYGAEDILYPLKIMKHQLIDAHRKNLHNCINLEMSFLLVLGDIEYKGINFNTSKWAETYKNNLIKFNEYKQLLDEFVFKHLKGTNFIVTQLDLFDDSNKCAIQWTSSNQVIELFKYYKICPKEVSKTTKKLSYTVEAKVLKASLNTINKDINEDLKYLLKTYIKFKELEQSVTTFGIQFFKYINPITKRLHSNYRQILNTGRISSSGPNLQNIPSDNSFRSAFDAPDGFKIVNADYSGQENICLVNASLDPDILEFYYEGHSDMHSFVARKIFKELEGLELSEIKANYPHLRQIAKSVSFALAYGGNGYTISNNLGISLEEGERIYNSYFESFPKLKEFFDKTIKTSMSKGYIEIDNITGRKFFFSEYDKLKTYKQIGEWKKFYTTKGKYERACLNYIIQGAAGSITKYAAILFRRWIIDNNLEQDVFITNLVHDEINLEVRESYADLAAENLEKCMAKAGSKWCTTIPLEADAVVTTYWTH